MSVFDFSTEGDLLGAIERGSAVKPIAFLVGAPFSQPAVVGTMEVLKMVEEALGTNLPPADFATVGDRYQKAMSDLQGRGPKQEVEDLIRRVVRQAFIPPADVDVATDKDRENLIDCWNLPPAVEALASLITRYPSRFSGPVLTTNFDPLLYVALRKHARSVIRIVLPQDGSLQAVELDPQTSLIVHLHGSWTGSTLHTKTQLAAPRPRLQASLGKLLRSHTLLVTAYGGWDDIFVDSLCNVLKDDTDTIDVLWTFLETEEAVINARYAKLFDRFGDAIGRLRFYKGIDCHTLMPKLRGRITLGGISATQGVTARRSAQAFPIQAVETHADGDPPQRTSGQGNAASEPVIQPRPPKQAMSRRSLIAGVAGGIGLGAGATFLASRPTVRSAPAEPTPPSGANTAVARKRTLFDECLEKARDLQKEYLIESITQFARFEEMTSPSPHHLSLELRTVYTLRPLTDVATSAKIFVETYKTNDGTLSFWSGTEDETIDSVESIKNRAGAYTKLKYGLSFAASKNDLYTLTTGVNCKYDFPIGGGTTAFNGNYTLADGERTIEYPNTFIRYEKEADVICNFRVVVQSNSLAIEPSSDTPVRIYRAGGTKPELGHPNVRRVKSKVAMISAQWPKVFPNDTAGLVIKLSKKKVKDA